VAIYNSVSHSYGTTTLATTSQQVLVADAPLLDETASLPSLTPTAGVALSGVAVAQFADGDPQASTGTYSATIDWGDGVSSTGTLVEVQAANPSIGQLATFVVDGDHTYPVKGNYTVSVLIQDTGGADLVSSRVLTVTSPPPPPPSTVSVSLSGSTRSDDPDRALLVPIGEAQVDLNQGAVQISQPLDFDASPDTMLGGSPALVYNSGTASVQPILQVSLTPGVVPQSVQFTLTWEGQPQTPVTWTPPAGSQPGQTFLIDLQLPSTVSASGVYQWSLTAQATFSGGSSENVTTSGQASVVVNTSSPYGAGWGLQSTTRLVSDLSGDMLRIDGDGNARLFTYNSSTNSFSSPAEDFGTLTGGLTTGYYLYTFKDQTQSYYDLNGRLTRIVQPNGLSTTYGYAAGQLSSVSTPDGGTTGLAYDASGLLQTVDEPGNRTVTLVHSGADLTEILDAAGNSRVMTYDGSHHLTEDQWAPFDSVFSFDASGLLTGVTQTPTSFTIVSANSAQIVNAAGQPLATLTDGVGDTTTYLLDSRSRVLQAIQPDGTSASWVLDNAGDPTSYTDFDHLQSNYSYNTSGDLTQVNYPNGTSETYQYDPTFHQVTQYVDPDHHTTVSQYDGKGELTLTTTASGTPQAATTTYTWLGGLMQSMIDPDNNSTAYAYAGLLLVSQVVYNALRQEVSSQSYSYDSAGNPSVSIDGDGKTTTTRYDGNNNLAQTIDPDGNTTSQEYLASGMVLSSTDGRGVENDYQYDNAGLPSGEVDGANTSAPVTLAMAYNAAGEETVDVDGDGHSMSFAYNRDGDSTLAIAGYGTQAASTASSAYDADGNPLLEVQGQGTSAVSSTSFAYDGVGDPTLTIAAFGTQAASTTSSAFDGDGNVLLEVMGFGSSAASSTSYGYDDNGNETLAITAFNTAQAATTTSKYDGDGNPIGEVDADGNSSSFGYDGLGDEVSLTRGVGSGNPASTSNSYDAAGNLMLSVDADNHSTSYAYDGDGNLMLAVTAFNTLAPSTTSYAYDADGNQTLVVTGYNSLAASSTSYGYDAHNNPIVTITAFNTPQAATTLSTYDGDDNPVGQVDADNNTSSFFYDSRGEQTLSVLGVGSGSPTNTSNTYDAAGNLILSVDADNHSTSYAYDPAGNLLLEVQGYNSPAAASISYAYNADSEETLAISGFNSSTPSSTSYGYDSNGNQTLAITALGTPQAATTTSKYDGDGNLIFQIDPNNTSSSYAYSALGDQTLSILGVGTTNADSTSSTYDGDDNLLMAVTALNSTAVSSLSYGYDSAGNQTLAVSGYGSGAAATVRYVYDAAGNLIQEIDPDNNTTTYKYDANGNCTAVIDPLGHTTGYQYDGDDNLLSQSNPNGTSINYTYNDLGEVLTETDYNANGTVQDSKVFTYDANGNLLTAGNGYGSYTMTYDGDGRLQTRTDPFGLTLTYGYDANNNVTSISDSLGGQTTYVYDANGNATSIQFSKGTTQARLDLTYTPDGQVSTMTRYKDTAGTQLVSQSSYSYDAKGNTTEIKHSNASGGVLADYQYTYDTANRLSSETDTENGGSPVTTPYSYDATSQLTQAGSSSYTYDSNGNRTLSGYSTGLGNQLQSDGTWNYSYDADGNTIQKTNIASGEYWTYAWNATNQLTLATDYNANGSLIQSVTFKYDAFGNLVEQDVYAASNQQTAVTKFAYDAAGNIWADLNGSNQLIDRRLFVNVNGQTQPFARIDASGNVAWYLTDHLGSIRLLTDNTGAVLDQIDYDAYGNITNETIAANVDRYKYASGQYNANLGMTLFGVRWDGNGHWISADPTGLAAGPNPYEAMGNAPTNVIDPSGLLEEELLDPERLEYLHKIMQDMIDEDKIDEYSLEELTNKVAGELYVTPGMIVEMVSGYYYPSGLESSEEHSKKDIANIKAQSERDFPAYNGEGKTVGEMGPEAADKIKEMGVETAIFVGSEFLPGPEAVIVPLAEKYGFRLIMRGGKKLWFKVAGKEVKELTKSEERLLANEYKKQMNNALKKNAPRTGTLLNGSEEYIVRNGAVARQNLARLEAEYTTATKGLKPKVVRGASPNGKPAWIDLETGQVFISDTVDAGFREGYLAEELNHYFQLKEKNLIGPGKTVSPSVEKALEADVIQRVEKMGFERYDYRKYAPYTDVPRPPGVAGN
jgi:RHS repeat-associated protein